MNALTPAELLGQLANPPTPYTDKLCALAKQLREDAETDQPDDQDGYEADAAGTFKG